MGTRDISMALLCEQKGAGVSHEDSEYIISLVQDHSNLVLTMEFMEIRQTTILNL